MSFCEIHVIMFVISNYDISKSHVDINKKQVGINKSHVSIDKSNVDRNKKHFNLNKWHGNIITLHDDILHLARAGQKSEMEGITLSRKELHRPWTSVLRFSMTNQVACRIRTCGEGGIQLLDPTFNTTSSD